MRLGFIGLGKMGGRMIGRLILDGHEVVAYDTDHHAVEKAAKAGAVPASSVADLISQCSAPRIVWIMVPAGRDTQTAMDACSECMAQGDLIIDGGNSLYHDTVRRADPLMKRGIDLLDVGTSGGMRGFQDGYCLMIGGKQKAFKRAEPLFRSLAQKDGYTHVGPIGSGHFVKMVHNGIEYAMLQAYGEGFEILRAKKEFSINLEKMARLWNRGSVIRSWILELAEGAFKNDPGLTSVKGYVEDSGEGRWAVSEAIDLDIPAPVITLSLIQRLSSRREDSFSARVIAALRKEFGGHSTRESD